VTFKYNLQINKIITSLGRTDRQKKLKVNMIQTTTTEATKTISQLSRILYIALIEILSKLTKTIIYILH
jgi:hypothetical protein